MKYLVKPIKYKQMDDLFTTLGDALNPNSKDTNEIYQVYLNGSWITDCDTRVEAETLINSRADEGEFEVMKLKL